MIKNILFDFDGVIVESNEIKAWAFYELYKPYGNDIANKVFEYYTAEGGIARQKKIKSYHKKLLNQELSGEQIDALSNRFSKLVVSNVSNAPFIKGVKTFITKNYSQMHFSIISGTPHHELLKICKAMEIDKFFKEICGSPKNKVDWCNEILDKYKLDKKQTVFIGDSKTDLDTANKIGVAFILREHDLNKNIFSDYKGTRISDFSNIQSILQTKGTSI